MQSSKGFRFISLDNKTQNDINKLNRDKKENYEFSFFNCEEIKKSHDSISIDEGSQVDTLSQTSDSSIPLSNKREKKNSVNKGFLFENKLISFYLGYEEYYRQLMPEKFSEYKKSKNYLSKNSYLKKIEQNNYFNYTNEYINYFHYSDIAHFNTNTYENGFPFYIYKSNFNKEGEIKETKGIKEIKENEDNKDNIKQNQQINNRKEEKEEKEEKEGKEEKDKNNDKYYNHKELSNKNKYMNRKNQYQKYNNNKGHKFKYYKRERDYINRKCNKFSKFNFCNNYREEKYYFYNSYYY